MKRLLRLVATTIVVILVSINPAEALFGSECKKPKSTYSQYLSSSKALQIKEANDKANANARTNAEFNRCLKNPKVFLGEKKLNDRQFYPRTKDGCSMWKIFYGGSVTFFEGQKTSYEEYKNAMLVVTSYKKCFDPSVYIEAVKWLKANPK